MRTIIAGSRTVSDLAVVEQAIAASGFRISLVLSGGARGPDTLAAAWAAAARVPVSSHPARWSEFGRAAGAVRNREMAEQADALIAVWDGASRGTADMIAQARRRGLAIFVHRVAAKADLP